MINDIKCRDSPLYRRQLLLVLQTYYLHSNALYNNYCFNVNQRIRRDVDENIILSMGKLISTLSPWGLSLYGYATQSRLPWHSRSTYYILCLTSPSFNFFFFFLFTNCQTFYSLLFCPYAGVRFLFFFHDSDIIILL